MTLYDFNKVIVSECKKKGIKDYSNIPIFISEHSKDKNHPLVHARVTDKGIFLDETFQTSFA